MTVQRSTLSIVMTCLMVLSAVPLQAGTARVLALGGDSGYFTAASNVLRWYGSLEDHPDQVTLEFGDLVRGQEDALSEQGRIGHGGGVHLRLTEDGRWGTAAFYFQDHLPKEPLEGAFTALWSRGFGPVQIGFGGRFTTYGESRVSTETGDRIDAQYIHQFGFGAAGNLRDGVRTEIAGEIINNRTELSGSLYELYADNWTSFGFRARAFVEIAPELTMVPVIEHTRDQRGLYAEFLAGPADRDAYVTSFGIGMGMRPDRDTHFMISGEYRYGSEDLRLHTVDHLGPVWETSDRTFFQIRGRASVETVVLPWLIARAAIQYVRVRDDIHRFAPPDDSGDVSHTETRRYAGGVAPLSLGVGLRHGNLMADFAYNDTSPVNPGLAGEGLFLGDGGSYSAFSLGWVF